MKRTILLLIISFFQIAAFAQVSKAVQREKILSMVPQYVFQNGFRVDYEFTLKDNWKSWLQLSPTLFISTDSEDISSYDYNSMRGLGFEVHHKYFMEEPDDRRGFYFAYGGGLQFLGIKSDQLVPYEYSENGTGYISYQNDEVTTKINRLLLNVVVGKQIVRYKPFIIDYYMGVGFRYSVDKNFDLMKTYNDTWFDYGYSGSLIVVGLKFGFNFSK